MSCNNYTSTINIKSTSETCDTSCSFSYKYNKLSSCVLKNAGNYLEIKTDGTDDVKFNNFSISVTTTRIYQPSIHLFNGSQADAEIIIQHAGPSGQNVFVCIPIVSKDGASVSNLFFNKIIPYSHSQTQVVNVSNWSLNDVFPERSPYYYYHGTAPYESCTMPAHVIVFDLDHSAKMNSDDINTLKSAISATEKSSIGEGGILMFNSKGANNGGDDGDDYEFVSCSMIDGVEDDDDNSTQTNRSNIPNMNLSENNITKGGATSYLAISGYIIAGIVLIIVLVFYVGPLISTKIGSMFRNTRTTGTTSSTTGASKS